MADSTSSLLKEVAAGEALTQTISDLIEQVKDRPMSEQEKMIFAVAVTHTITQVPNLVPFQLQIHLVTDSTVFIEQGQMAVMEMDVDKG